jgi:hypothetical protein
MNRIGSMCLFVISIIFALGMTVSFVAPVVERRTTATKPVIEVTETESSITKIQDKQSVVEHSVKAEVVEVKKVVKEPVKEPTYSDDDLYLLAQLIQAEAGYDDCSDSYQREVASVVLNRVADIRYPDTIRDVIYDTKYAVQYGSTINGMINNTPSQRAIANAKYVLTHGSVCPPDVLTQSEYIQGDIWKQYTYHGVTIYLCFVD